MTTQIKEGTATLTKEELAKLVLDAVEEFKLSECPCCDAGLEKYDVGIFQIEPWLEKRLAQNSQEDQSK